MIDEQSFTIGNAVGALKTEVQEIAERYGMPGLRWGRYVTYVTPKEGDRRMKAALVQELLLKYGVPLEEFEACYERGNPRVEVKFVDLEKPKRERTKENG